MPATTTPTTRVQCYLTCVAFPESRRKLRQMIRKNRSFLDYPASDLDSLLDFQPGKGLVWSAFAWVAEGDLVFFYRTASATRNIVALKKKYHTAWGRVVRALHCDGSAYSVLRREIERSATFESTLFGCGKIAEASAYQQDELAHFRGRHMAPLGEIHIFNRPLPFKEWKHLVHVHGPTNYFVGRKAFDELRVRLRAQNSLPEFLENAESVALGFRKLTPENWMEVACRAEARFLTEAQLREYFADHFLSAVQDVGSVVHKECRCFRLRRETGRADYFVEVDEQWIPVEAKLSLRNSPGTSEQAQKYLGTDRFIPAGRSKAIRIDRPPSVALVVDREGVYIVDKRGFVVGQPGQPGYRRVSMDKRCVQSIRAALIERVP